MSSRRNFQKCSKSKLCFSPFLLNKNDFNIYPKEMKFNISIL